jgi:hypothetical protein
VKGIAHFVTGVAVATCFAQIVHGASQSLSFVPLLGGVAGLLPDTLDFRLVRFFERPDEEVDLARITMQAGQPDAATTASAVAGAVAGATAQSMASAIARAIDRAFKTGRPVRVKLHTVKVAADRWRQYTVVLDGARDEVVVRLGPVVTTAGMPYVGSEIPGSAVGRAKVGHHIRNSYGAETTVDVFDGPSLAFARCEGGSDAVEATFLPWHRTWTHSLVLALSLGIVGWLVAPVCGLAMGLAATAHLMEDQMGFLGSSLLWPFSRRRIGGLKLFHSGDALPNLLAVWISLALVLLNLDRFSSAPRIPVLPYVLGIVVAPCLLLLSLGAWQRRRGQVSPASDQADSRMLDPTRPVDT